MKTFSPFLIPYQRWLGEVRNSSVLASARTYCLLGAERLDWRYYRDILFNRDEANAIYVKNYTSKDLKTKQPGTTLQRDINATYSLHRSFVARHKTRMQTYRDDLSNKGKRIPYSIGMCEQRADTLNKTLKGLA